MSSRERDARARLASLRLGGTGDGEAGVPGDDDAAAATTGGTVLGGGAWNITSRVVPQLYVVIVSVAAARYLGPAGMGRQSYIAFVAMAMTSLLSGGLSLGLMRFVGEARGLGRSAELRSLVSFAWRAQGGVALVGSAALCVVALLGADPQSAWVLAAAGCGLGILHTVPSSVLFGLQKWREASIVGMATGGVAVPLVIVVLAYGGGITGMFAVEAAVSAVNLVLIGIWARRVLGRTSASRRSAGELRGATARYALVSTGSVALTLIVWRRSEFFFLERYASDPEIAVYSIAFSAVTAVRLIPEAMGAVISPAFATLFGAGASDRIRSGYSRAVRLLLLLTLPLTGGLLVLGPPALRIVYGEDYAAAGPILAIMVATLPLVAVLNVSEGLLVGLGRVRAPLIAGGIAAIANIALAFALIPEHGAMGAALASTTAQIVAALAVFAPALRTIGRIRLEPFVLLRAAGASIGASAIASAILAVNDDIGGVVVAAIAGVVALLVLARLLRVLTRDDAVWLETTTRRYLPPSLSSIFRLFAPTEARSRTP